MNGNKVSPLLDSRINKWIELYRKVEHISHLKTLLICSGGQGSDETVPEGKKCEIMKLNMVLILIMQLLKSNQRQVVYLLLMQFFVNI